MFPHDPHQKLRGAFSVRLQFLITLDQFRPPPHLDAFVENFLNSTFSNVSSPFGNSPIETSRPERPGFRAPPRARAYATSALHFLLKQVGRQLSDLGAEHLDVSNLQYHQNRLQVGSSRTERILIDNGHCDSPQWPQYCQSLEKSHEPRHTDKSSSKQAKRLQC